MTTYSLPRTVYRRRAKIELQQAKPGEQGGTAPLILSLGVHGKCAAFAPIWRRSVLASLPTKERADDVEGP